MREPPYDLPPCEASFTNFLADADLLPNYPKASWFEKTKRLVHKLPRRKIQTPRQENPVDLSNEPFVESETDCQNSFRLLDLPSELLTLICLESRGSLKALRCTCKQLQAYVEPLLFQEFVYVPHRHRFLDLEDLSKSRIASLVEHLRFDHRQIHFQHELWRWKLGPQASMIPLEAYETLYLHAKGAMHLSHHNREVQINKWRTVIPKLRNLKSVSISILQNDTPTRTTFQPHDNLPYFLAKIFRLGQASGVPSVHIDVSKHIHVRDFLVGCWLSTQPPKLQRIDISMSDLFADEPQVRILRLKSCYNHLIVPQLLARSIIHTKWPSDSVNPDRTFINRAVSIVIAQMINVPSLTLYHDDYFHAISCQELPYPPPYGMTLSLGKFVDHLQLIPDRLWQIQSLELACKSIEPAQCRRLIKQLKGRTTLHLRNIDLLPDNPPDYRPANDVKTQACWARMLTELKFSPYKPQKIIFAGRMSTQGYQYWYADQHSSWFDIGDRDQYDFSPLRKRLDAWFNDDTELPPPRIDDHHNPNAMSVSPECPIAEIAVPTRLDAQGEIAMEKFRKSRIGHTFIQQFRVS